MVEGARFGHVNLIARDWRRLADFYIELFGCRIVPPQRDYADAALAAGTGVRGASLSGVHLLLPGHGEDGPTLEIYQYTSDLPKPEAAANRLGYGHIAFAVDHVDEMRQKVVTAGGRAIGEVVGLTTADGRLVTWCYVTDPEGNIVELQSWAEA